MVQKVSFRYSDTTPWIYKDLEFGLDLDTRLALVGPNGAGKSTLLKLVAGEVRNIKIKHFKCYTTKFGTHFIILIVVVQFFEINLYFLYK